MQRFHMNVAVNEIIFTSGLLKRTAKNPRDPSRKPPFLKQALLIIGANIVPNVLIQYQGTITWLLEELLTIILQRKN